MTTIKPEIFSVNKRMHSQTVLSLMFMLVVSTLTLISSTAWALPADRPTELSPQAADTLKGSQDEKIIKFNQAPGNKKEINKIESVDSTKYTIFGDLLRDDPYYNKKNPLWRPALSVIQQQIVLCSVNRLVFDAPYSKISLKSWEHNLKNHWVWDNDRFGMNFLFHPFGGGSNVAAGLSNGYNYWESVPMAVAGSAIWELFGENTTPSYNDIINTPISGGFFGEVMYRLSSNILDDRTTGWGRVARETAAGLLSQTRLINRLTSGKMFRITPVEVYQKEPLNIELSAGGRNINDGRSFGTGPKNLWVSSQIDYGYPFEQRDWRPFDYFQIRAGANLGQGRKIIENVTGYGVLFGKTRVYKHWQTMTGLFQHYDYFDNKTFELGNMAFTASVMSKYPINKTTWLYTNFHLGPVPMEGNSTRLGPDTLQVRDYNFGCGAMTKLESGINFGWASFELIGYYYWLHTYVGAASNNYVGIFRPRITIRLYNNFNIGFEQLFYTSDRFTKDFGDFHSVRTEQRAYLMFNVGNFKLQ